MKRRSFLGALLATGCAPLPAPAAPKNPLLEAILACGKKLDEMNVPETGRVFHVPVSMAAEVSDHQIDAIRHLYQGEIGVIDRLTIYTTPVTPARPRRYW